jgi:hypothetical protein
VLDAPLIVQGDGPSRIELPVADERKPVRVVAIQFQESNPDFSSCGGLSYQPGGAPADVSVVWTSSLALLRSGDQIDLRAGRPSDAAPLYLPGCTSCATFESQRVTLRDGGAPNTGGVSLIIDLGNQSALVATYAPQVVYRIKLDTNPPSAEPITLAPPNGYLAGGTRTNDGHIVIGDDRGRIWTATITPGSTTLSLSILARTSTDSIVILSGSSPTDLFAFSKDSGAVTHVGTATAQTWTHLHSPPPDTVDSASLQWIGPQEALVVRTSTPTLVHLRSRVRFDEAIEVNETGRDLNSVASLPKVGVVVGTGRGSIYGSADLVSFRDLGNTMNGTNVFSFAPSPRGFLYGGWAGIIGEYLAVEQTFCTPMQIASSNANIMVWVGDALLIGGGSATTDTKASVTVLRQASR